jgi:hypothetical protein
VSRISTEAAIRGRIGAHSRWARTPDRTVATAPARRASATALEARLVAEFGLDPGAHNFEQRLAHARKAHFARLAYASAQARRKGGR